MSKFKIGDRVVIRGLSIGQINNIGKKGVISQVDEEGHIPYNVCVEGSSLYPSSWYTEESLELIPPQSEKTKDTNPKQAADLMTQEKFDELIEAIFEYRIKGVMCRKSAEYCRQGDKLYNFRRAAEMSGKTPLECLRGMKLKHDVSVDDMLNDERNGKVHSQALWMEKLSDQINYTLLEWAILHEKHSWTIPGGC